MGFRGHGSMLSHEEARTFYDGFGTKQDWQRFFEDRAVTDLVEHLSLESAQSVFEFGCGTGRLAEHLLQVCLPSDATYLGIDVSPTMLDLSTGRLFPFGPRAEVRLTSGEMRLNAPPDRFDRFISTYVLDLLSEDDIQGLLKEAYRILSGDGLLGLVSLTHGPTLLSRTVEKLWSTIHRIHPALVGGCRPLHLEEFIKGGWQIEYLRKVVRFGVPSEVLVAHKT